MSGKKQDAFGELVGQINDIRDELGLPRLPIETIPEAFGKMSKDLRKKLEPYSGPIYKENVAGWVSMMLELVGKHNEDLGRLSIEEHQWAIDHIRLRDAGKFTVKNVAAALEFVDQLVVVLAEHGEKNAGEFGQFLRRRITHQIILGYYLPKLPGAQNNPELAVAVAQQIIPLLPEQPEQETIEAELIELDFGSNGRRLPEEESTR